MITESEEVAEIEELTRELAINAPDGERPASPSTDAKKRDRAKS